MLCVQYNPYKWICVRNALTFREARWKEGWEYFWCGGAGLAAVASHNSWRRTGNAACVPSDFSALSLSSSWPAAVSNHRFVITWLIPSFSASQRAFVLHYLRCMCPGVPSLASHGNCRKTNLLGFWQGSKSLINLLCVTLAMSAWC